MKKSFWKNAAVQSLLASLICIVLGLVLTVTVARIITLNKTQAEYNEKVAYYTQLVEKEEKRSEELVEFEKYTQTNA